MLFGSLATGCMQAGGEGVTLQTGNRILEENAFKQTTHGIFPSPQVPWISSAESRK